MTDSTPTSNPKRFPSFASVRTAHRELLKQYHQTQLTSELLVEVQNFLLRGRATGALLDAEDDRWAAQSLLDYWLSILYRQGTEPPDATLAEFDPSLAPELEENLCPYLGLAAFQERDRKLFYGRQRLLDRLLDRLGEHRLLAVNGSSGSGKSSLVLGGLIPRLKAGKLPQSQRWHYYSPMVPGSHPLENLACILCPEASEMETWVTQQIDRFQTDSNHLLKLLDAGSTEPGVLVIDQFEETFTLCPEGSMRQALIDNLLTVVRSPKSRHVAIVTIRTDFESRVALHSDLKQAFDSGHVSVTAMDARELREAIEKPAESVGLKFEEGLVDRLLEDVLGEPAALPLLQFTLLKLWENRERNRVTWETYKRLGGGRLALSRSADEFYNDLIPEDQTAAKRILLKMVKPTQGLEVTSSRIPRQSLYKTGEARDRIKRVLEKLIQAQLVRLTQGERVDDTQVEVAHEALVRNWPRLVEWLEDERVNLRTRWRLKSAVEQWRERGKDPSVLWWGRLLQDARCYEDLNPIEREFIRCSLVAEREQQKKELEEEQKLLELNKKLTLAKTRFYIGNKFYIDKTLLSIFIISILSVCVALSYKKGIEAEKNLRKVNLLLQAEKIENELDSNPEEGLVSAIQMIGQCIKEFKVVFQPIRKTLQNAAWKSIPTQNFSGSILGLEYSPNENFIVTVSNYGTVNLWNSDGTLVKTLERKGFEEYQARVTSVKFSPDGRLIAITNVYGKTKFWKPDGTLVTTIESSQERITSVSFSNSENLIAITSADENAKILKFNGDVITKKYNLEKVKDIALSPDGTLISTVSTDGIASILKLDRTFVREINDRKEPMSRVVFSPDGRSIATVSEDGIAQIWNTRNGDLIKTLEEHRGRVSNITFSPDITFHLHASFTPNSSSILTTNLDESINIWTIDGSFVSIIDRSSRSSASLHSVYFGGEGRKIITIDKDGMTRYWDLNGQFITEFFDSNRWENLLQLACDEMRDRQIFSEPKNEMARQAKKTCEKEVWN